MVILLAGIRRAVIRNSIHRVVTRKGDIRKVDIRKEGMLKDIHREATRKEDIHKEHILREDIIIPVQATRRLKSLDSVIS